LHFHHELVGGREILTVWFLLEEKDWVAESIPIVGRNNNGGFECGFSSAPMRPAPDPFKEAFKLVFP
jgi:hypothetical protein